MEHFRTTGALLRALDFAARRHATQRRKDEAQTPYINHPIAVAALLANEGGVTDIATLQAALLHDTVEDTATTIEELEAVFGAEVAGIVREVTDDKRLDGAERKRLQLVNAPRKSQAAAMVKLADKTCNLRDIAQCPPHDWSAERKVEYAAWASQVVRALPAVPGQLVAAFELARAELLVEGEGE